MPDRRTGVITPVWLFGAARTPQVQELLQELFMLGLLLDDMFPDPDPVRIGRVRKELLVVCSSVEMQRLASVIRRLPDALQPCNPYSLESLLRFVLTFRSHLVGQTNGVRHGSFIPSAAGRKQAQTHQASKRHIVTSS